MFNALSPDSFRMAIQSSHIYSHISSYFLQFHGFHDLFYSLCYLFYLLF